MITGAAYNATFANSAIRARMDAQAAGYADCIHYAPSWASRADALYELANHPDNFRPGQWSEGPLCGSPMLLADGRMVVAFDHVVWFEPREVRT